MLKKILPISALFLTILQLQGCATSRETYLPNGAKAHAIQCGGTMVSMSACYEKAADICKEQGYYIYREGNYYQGNSTTSISSINGSGSGASYAQGVGNKFAGITSSRSQVWGSSQYHSSPIIDRYITIACGQAPSHNKK